MAKHNATERHPARDRAAVRTMALAMVGLTIFVIAMIASYSGAFAKPTLHHMEVAVAGPEQLIDGIRSQDSLEVTAVGDDATARAQVFERKADAAFVVPPDGELKIYVAGGGGRSVADAAETVGRTIARQGGSHSRCGGRRTRIGGRPVRHRRVLRHHLHLDRRVGWRDGVRSHHGQCARAGDLLAHRHAGRVLGSAGRRRDGLRRCDSRCVDGPYVAGAGLRLFGALWLYAMAVGGAVTGVAAAFGSVASMALTAFLVVIGNAAAAGPVGRPLLSGFYSTFTAIVPQGSGVALLRSVEYFGGNGAAMPVVTLLIWGAAGCLLAIVATATRVNYRALYERFPDLVRRDRAVLRPGLAITGRLRRRRRRHRSGSTAGWSGPTRSTTTSRSAASSVRSSWTPIWPSRAGVSPIPSARTTTRRGRRSTRSTWRRRWPGPGWNSAWPPRAGRRRSNAA